MRALLLLGAAILVAIGCSSTVGDYPMATPCTLGDGGSCPPPTITDSDGGAVTTTTSGTTSTSSGTGGAGSTGS